MPISIREECYGYWFEFTGFITEAEMKSWVEESRKALRSAPKQFSIFIDMRGAKPMSPEAQAVAQVGQRLWKEGGMQRSCVALDSAVTTMQFRRIAKLSGIDAWERYVDASSTPTWRAKGEAWLADGVDPDVRAA